jgi:hypothetical protein
MNLEDFRRYLKKKGKKEKVIERNINTIEFFQKFLKNENRGTISEVSFEDINSFVDKIEKTGGSAKGYLYVLMNYFKYLEKMDLFSYVAKLREERTSKTRRIFPLKDFMDIDPLIIEKLSSIEIKNVKQMLEQGRSKEQRQQLAKRLDISENKILELVSLSDLTRLGYVKRKLSRLYYNAGIHSPLQLTEFEPDSLHYFLKDYVMKSSWKGMIPNKKDLANNIKNARKLSKIVEH